MQEQFLKDIAGISLQMEKKMSHPLTALLLPPLPKIASATMSICFQKQRKMMSGSRTFRYLA
jgi:hypothetical protein